MTQPKHPSRDELLRFAHGMPQENEQAVQEHVSACDTCTEFLETLPKAPVEEKLGPLIPATTALLTRVGPTPSIGCIGDYQLLRELSSGGMGIVYEAQKKGAERHVVLKTIKPDRVASEEMRLRFEREVRVLEKFNHDHIMPIFDFGHDGDVMYMVMPRLPGRTLEQHLRDQKNLAIDEIARIGVECLKGLAAAHGVNVIHRDIKPSNIYLEEMPDRPARPRVRLIDFGLAKPQHEAHGVTRYATACGTPGYMPPEQLQGRTVDQRADLFALGCVLYRMATGVLPFPGKSPGNENSFDVFADQLGDPDFCPTPPSQLNPHVPLALNDLILRLLEKTPAKRPASAGEAMIGLAQLQAQAVVGAKTVGGLAETQTFQAPPSPPANDAAPSQSSETPAPGEKRRPIGCTITITFAACLAFAGLSVGAFAVVTAPGAKAEREKYEAARRELETLKQEIELETAQMKLAEKQAAEKHEEWEHERTKYKADQIAFEERMRTIRESQLDEKAKLELERTLQAEKQKAELRALEREQEYTLKKLEALAKAEETKAAAERAAAAAQRQTTIIQAPAPYYYRYHPYYGWGGGY